MLSMRKCQQLSPSSSKKTAEVATFVNKSAKGPSNGRLDSEYNAMRHDESVSFYAAQAACQHRDLEQGMVSCLAARRVGSQHESPIHSYKSSR